MILGSHVSFKKDTQLVGSVKEALSYGSSCFMFYTGAPQNTVRNNIDLDKTEEAIKLMEENNIDINKFELEYMMTEKLYIHFLILGSCECYFIWQKSLKRCD